MTQSFKDIMAWQKAHVFVLDVYRMTTKYPTHERFGLCSQFQRAAVSIPANIAEGYKRISKADKLRFFNIAQGSLEECRYYILLSKDLNYITGEDFQYLNKAVEDTSYLLNGYCRKIANSRFEE